MGVIVAASAWRPASSMADGAVDVGQGSAFGAAIKGGSLKGSRGVARRLWPKTSFPENCLVIVGTIWHIGRNLSLEKTVAAPSQRSDKLDIRISPAAKRVLQEAARERHITISQFVIDSALSTAQDVLAERTRIGLTSEQWVTFTAALDAPPQRHPRMERLLKEPTILD